jgi:hypothetical protein
MGLGTGPWEKNFAFCYFVCKSEDSKSYDMQNIHAIPGEFSEVMTMARNRNLWKAKATPNILWWRLLRQRLSVLLSMFIF